MNSGKLSHTLWGWLVTVLTAGWAWGAAHCSLVVGLIVGAFSIRASLWTARAAQSTIKKKNEDREEKL